MASCKPWDWICFWIRCRLAISTFSGSVYPGRRRTSRRSCKAWGIVWSTLAVAMKNTEERSNSTSR